MDSEDERTLHPLWNEFDAEVNQAIEKIAWKYLPKLDKLCAERLGYGTPPGEERFERFNCLCGFVERVYLKPLLEDARASGSSDNWGLLPEPEF